MSCRRVQLLLGAHRELDRTERHAVDEHLRGCEACQAAWRDEQRVRALIAAVPVLDPPATLERRLLEIPRTPPGPGVVGPPAAALVALVLVLAGLLVASRPGGALDRWSGSAPGSDSDTPALVVVPGAGGTAEALVSAPSGPVARRRPVDLVTAAPSAPPTATARPEATATLVRTAVAPRPDLGRDVAPESPYGAGSGAGAGQATNHPPEPTDEPAHPAPSAEPSATELLCVNLSAAVFADLAGAGPLATCQGCDGVWGDDDAARAAALGLSLPMRVQVLGGPEGWVACPAYGGLTREVTEAGDAHVAFPLFPAAGCPIPPATDTPAAVTEPVLTPAAASHTPPAPGETAPVPATTTADPPVPAGSGDRS